MFRFFSQDRVHESIVASALIAASVTLHVGWILNLLVVRVDAVQSWLTFSSSIGPVSGMYSIAIFSYLLLFLVSVAFLKGRDCSHIRSSIFGFFLFSLFAFFVMTLPFIYSFSLAVE